MLHERKRTRGRSATRTGLVPAAVAKQAASTRRRGNLVRRPAHIPGLKCVIPRETAALFTDLPQMRVGTFAGQSVEYQSMRLLALSTACAQRAGVLCCVLFAVMSAQALAQTSATDNPSPKAEQPLAPAEVNAPAEEKPAATAEQKPAPAEEKPAVAQDKPAASEEKPAVSEEKAAVIEQKPAPAEEKPAIAQDKPEAVEQKTTVSEDKPAAAEQKPAIADDKPAVEEKPVVAQDKPAVPEQPAVQEAKPAPAEQKPAIAADKPAAEAAKPEVAQDKSAGKSSESAAAHKREDRRKLAQSIRATRLLKRAAHAPRERTMIMLCTRFRTYDASSGTYRGYDGQTHSCR
jgi:BA14K-like protein